MSRDASVSPSPRKAFADRRRDPATKREAVLKTAAQLFIEKSYGRTSMNDVADRLKITKPALYHYFDNKEDILLECYRLGVGLIEETLSEIADHGGSGLQKVEAFIHSYALVMTVNYGRCVMRLDEGDLTSEGRAEVRAYKRKIDRRLRGFIQEGIEDGSIAQCDTKIAAFSIAGALNWICMWYEPEGALSPAEIATQFARTLTQGLAAPKRSAKDVARTLSLRRRDSSRRSARLPEAVEKSRGRRADPQVRSRPPGRLVGGRGNLILREKSGTRASRGPEGAPQGVRPTSTSACATSTRLRIVSK